MTNRLLDIFALVFIIQMDNIPPLDITLLMCDILIIAFRHKVAGDRQQLTPSTQMGIKRVP